MIEKIDNLIKKIYNGNFDDIDLEIIDLLTFILTNGVKNDNEFMSIVKSVNENTQTKNYVHIVDIFEFKLKAIL